MNRFLIASAVFMFVLGAMGEMPPISVNSPHCWGLNKCDEWCLGETYTISWNTREPIQAGMTIALRVSGSAPDAPPALVIATGTANDGSFDWTVPNSVAPGDYFLRVRTDDATVVGDGPSLKIISGVPAIRVDTPNYVMCLGGLETITWKKTCKMQPKITITLRHAGSAPDAAPADVIATGIGNIGSYPMGINPEKITPGDYFIRVRTDDMSVIGDSGIFKIGECNVYLQLISPHGGEKLASGADLLISWNKKGWAGKVDLILLQNGHYVGTIAKDLPAMPSTFNWKAGQLLNGKMATPGSGFRVRVKRSYMFIYKGKETLQDESDGDFTILFKML